MKGYLAIAVLDVVVNGEIVTFDNSSGVLGVMGIYATREDAEAMAHTVIEVTLGRDPRKKKNELH